nr:MAG TPA: hypothetical protein [Caudoviricetes sp.]
MNLKRPIKTYQTTVISSFKYISMFYFVFYSIIPLNCYHSTTMLNTGESTYVQ